MPKQNLRYTPVILSPIYHKRMKTYAFVYNPFSQAGITILNKTGERLFTAIDGKKTINDYVNLKYDGKEETIALFNGLYEGEIISFKEKKTKKPTLNKSQKESITVWVYLTEQCNFRCSYCFLNKNPKKMDPSTMDLLITRLYELKKKNGYKIVKLVLAGGEPLLEMDLLKHAVKKNQELEKKKGRLIDVRIITNASLLTEETAKYLQENKVSVAVSLDGLGKNNDAERKLKNGEGTFVYIQKGLNIAKKYEIVKSISITVTPQNAKGLPELVRYCLKNRLSMKIGFYKRIGAERRDVLENDIRKIVPSYKQSLRIVYEYYQKKKISYSPLLDHMLLDDLKYMSNLGENNCDAGNTYISISTEGKVELCPATNQYLAHISDKDFIGAARKKSFPIRKEFSVENISICKTCIWKYICSGGCMLERIYLNDKKNQPTYRCVLNKAIMPYVLELEGKRIYRNYLSSAEV